jgi:hypothetical protein
VSAAGYAAAARESPLKDRLLVITRPVSLSVALDLLRPTALNIFIGPFLASV